MTRLDRPQDGWLVNLGQTNYRQVLDLQHRLVQLRRENHVPDILLLVEHDPVITMGRRVNYEHVLASPRQLAAEGIEIVHAERGGSVTYHGPGQLVSYPIVHLSQRKLGVRTFIHLLEEIIIRTLARFAIPARRHPEHRGVWVQGQKVASVGVAIRHWVSFHGLALNVSPNLDHFCYISPCGLKHELVTSMTELLDNPPDMEVVRNLVAEKFCRFFPELWKKVSSGQLVETAKYGGMHRFPRGW
ncbi:MAG: lipoyl(octanoyl) transferase LipB [Syntrophobacteria bacterium]